MLVFRYGKGPEVVPPVYLNGSPVRVVTSFKYLGHYLTENLRDDMDMERERRALAVRCNMLSRRFSKCTTDVKTTLFRAFCQCFYTCSLWCNYTKRSYNALRVQYNDAFRILMKQPRYCSAKTMFADAGVPDFYAIMRSRIASVWTNVWQNSQQNDILALFTVNPSNKILKHWTAVHLDENSK
ncbi:uncharacterized protein LOC134665511 [Cydia fagiglandana]|uniref:uncharacterized protein LOC134665511 n=1 Tax=Cydia fagiglandana TaxID=1458189 RepID=UPI002FEE4F63